MTSKVYLFGLSFIPFLIRPVSNNGLRPTKLPTMNICMYNALVPLPSSRDLSSVIHLSHILTKWHTCIVVCELAGTL